jgi:ABC-2 type transport system ATP-binding protein
VSGSPVELKHQLGGDTITLSLANSDGGVRDRSKRIVSGIQGVTKVLDIETGLAAYAKDASALVPDIVRLFDENGIRLTSISVTSASLDDVFLQHTGRRIRSEELSKVDTWKGHA